MYRFIILSILFCIVASSPLSHASNVKKNVLFLNSYHNGYHWSDGLLSGVRDVLANSEHRIDLQIEYMDAKKFPYDDFSQNLFALYQKKFKNESFDIIVLSDNDALNFVNEHRDTLFAGIPVVFCGINDLKPSDIAKGNITGVVEVFDFLSTLKVARQLHPEKKKMIVLTDDSTAGTGIRKQIQKITEQNETGLEMEYWTQLSMEEAQHRVQQLPSDAMLFIAPYYQTSSDGSFYTSEEVSEAIYQHSTVPIYSAWKFMIGYGVLGGRVLSSFEQGKTAGKMAIKVLDGTPIEDIPIINEPEGSYIFDWVAMQKLFVHEEALPPGSTIINKPPAIYSISKELFWTIMVSMILLLITLVGMVVAMTGRRKVELKIKDQLAFQETLMDSIPQLISWKDTEGRYLGVNRAFSDFFELQESRKIVGATTQELIKDQGYVSWSKAVDRAVIESKKPFRKLRRNVTQKDGSEAWVEVNKVPLKGQDDRLIGVLSTADNITRQHNLEKQLQQAQKLEAIGTLAGGIAHDFNNILTSIINSTELAIGDIEPQTQTEADLKRVLKAAHRGGRVVQQILSFSRPSTEGFQPTDLTEIALEVVHLMEASTPANVKVSCRIEENSAFVVHADPTQMHQALLNLTTNGYHALRERGGELAIELARVKKKEQHRDAQKVSSGDFIRLSVRDTGPGIPPKLINKIFDPFFSTKSKTEGTGLGLAVVHGIIHNHHGNIEVKSEQGRGTSFIITLPATRGRASKESQESLPLIDMGGEILFVEDDLDQLQTTPRILEDLGFRVTGVQDPVEAFKLANSEENHFTLLISDFDLPHMSGADLAKSLPHIPTILVSGREDARLEARECTNILQVLIKPYYKKDLIQALHHVSRKV